MLTKSNMDLVLVTVRHRQLRLLSPLGFGLLKYCALTTVSETKKLCYRREGFQGNKRQESVLRTAK